MKKTAVSLIAAVLAVGVRAQNSGMPAPPSDALGRAAISAQKIVAAHKAAVRKTSVIGVSVKRGDIKIFDDAESNKVVYAPKTLRVDSIATYVMPSGELGAEIRGAADGRAFAVGDVRLAFHCLDTGSFMTEKDFNGKSFDVTVFEDSRRIPGTKGEGSEMWISVRFKLGGNGKVDPAGVTVHGQAVVNNGYFDDEGAEQSNEYEEVLFNR